MNKITPYFIACSLCILLLAGCTAATSQTAKPALVPGWCKAAGLGSANQIEYTGRADAAPSREEAIAQASAQALSQLTNELGMTVQSQSTLKQRETNGVFSSDVKLEVSIASKPINVRGVRVVRQFAAEQGQGFTACAEVSIPAQEKKRLKRLELNKTALVLHCSGTHISAGACPHAVVNKISAMLSDRGAQLLPATQHKRLDTKVMQLAMQQNAAYIIAVTIESRFLEEFKGEFFAEANISLKHIDSTDQKSLIAIEVPPEKGGHITARDAELAAIDVALKNLEYELINHTF
jgi:hypothetical protein